MHKILIVDDATLQHDYLVETVKPHLDAEFIHAKNGQLGLERLDENHDIDLIITDVAMPVMTGIDFVKQLRERDYGKDIPVLVMSSSVEEKESGAFDGLNIKAFVTKPVSKTGIVAAIKKLLDESKKAA